MRQSLASNFDINYTFKYISMYILIAIKLSEIYIFKMLEIN